MNKPRTEMVYRRAWENEQGRTLGVVADLATRRHVTPQAEAARVSLLAGYVALRGRQARYQQALESESAFTALYEQRLRACSRRAA